MTDAALPSPPPLSRIASEGRFVVQMVVNYLHED
ncbi:MAG: hypothetical protein K0R53_2084 [Burkholderiales bacterium]|jgi:hypothetical protein|nr:hypothetical protein [Burkholderiales bacterium]